MYLLEFANDMLPVFVWRVSVTARHDSLRRLPLMAAIPAPRELRLPVVRGA